jgi:hypothetical protein
MGDRSTTQQIDELERLLWEQMEDAPEDDLARVEWRENLRVRLQLRNGQS